MPGFRCAADSYHQVEGARSLDVRCHIERAGACDPLQPFAGCRPRSALQRLLPILDETSTTALGPEADAYSRAVSETVADTRQRCGITPRRAWRYLHRPMLKWKLGNRPCPRIDGLSHYLPCDLLSGQEKSSLKRIADRNVCIGVDGL